MTSCLLAGKSQAQKERSIINQQKIIRSKRVVQTNDESKKRAANGNMYAKQKKVKAKSKQIAAGVHKPKKASKSSLLILLTTTHKGTEAANTISDALLLHAAASNKNTALRAWISEAMPAWERCLQLYTRSTNTTFRNMLLLYSFPMLSSWRTCAQLFNAHASEEALSDGQSVQVLGRCFLKATEMIGESASWEIASRVATHIGQRNISANDSPVHRFIRMLPAEVTRPAYASLYGTCMRSAPWEVALCGFSHLQHTSSLQVHHASLLLQNLKQQEKNDQILLLGDALLNAMHSVHDEAEKASAQTVKRIIQEAREADLRQRVRALHLSASWEECVHVLQESRQMHHTALLRGVEALFRQPRRRAALSHPRMYAWLHRTARALRYKLSPTTITHIIFDCSEKQELKLAGLYAAEALRDRRVFGEESVPLLEQFMEIVERNQQSVALGRVALCDSLQQLKRAKWEDAIALFQNAHDDVRLDAQVIKVLLPKIAQRPNELAAFLQSLSDSLKFQKGAARVQSCVRKMAQHGLTYQNTLLLKLLGRYFPGQFPIERYYAQVMNAYKSLVFEERQDIAASIWGARQCKEFVACRADAISDELEVALRTSDWAIVLRLFERHVSDFAYFEEGNVQRDYPIARSHRELDHCVLQDIVSSEMQAESVQLLRQSMQFSALLEFMRVNLLPIDMRVFGEILKDRAQQKSTESLLCITALLKRIGHNIMDGYHDYPEMECFLKSVYEYVEGMSQLSLSTEEFDAILCVTYAIHQTMRKAEKNFKDSERKILFSFVKQRRGFSIKSVCPLFGMLLHYGENVLLVSFLADLQNLHFQHQAEMEGIFAQMVHLTRRYVGVSKNANVCHEVFPVIALQSLVNYHSQKSELNLSEHSEKVESTGLTKVTEDLKRIFTSQIECLQIPFAEEIQCKLLAMCRRHHVWQFALCIYEKMRKESQVRDLKKVPLIVKRLLALSLSTQWKALRELHFHTDPICLAILLRAMQVNSNDTSKIDATQFLLHKPHLFKFGKADIRFVWQTLFRCGQYAAAEQLYFHARLQKVDVHKAILREIGRHFRMECITSLTAQGMRMLWSIAFDLTWFGMENVLLDMPSWVMNIRKRFAAKLRHRDRDDLYQRTLDELDFFAQCAAQLLHTNLPSAAVLCALYSHGIIPRKTHMEALSALQNRRHTDSAEIELSNRLFKCFFDSLQILEIPEQLPGGISQSTATEIIKKVHSIEDFYSLGDWAAGLTAMQESTQSMFQRGLSEKITPLAEKFIFASALERAVESTLKADRFGTAVTLLKIAYSQTPSSPFLHVPLLRVLQSFARLLKENMSISETTHRMLDYLLHRGIAHGLSVSLSTASKPSPRQPPGASIQAAYLHAYFTYWKDAQQPSLFIQTASMPFVFPAGYLRPKSIESNLARISRLPAPMRLNGLTSSVAPLIAIAHPSLVQMIALRDVRECKSWQGALYRLQLSWGRKQFDFAYERAALRAVILHAHRHDFTNVLQWSALKRVLAMHAIDQKETASLKTHSFYAAVIRASNVQSDSDANL